MRQFTAAALSLAVIIAFLVLFADAMTNPTYQNGLTTRYQAQQQTKRVEAQEWGATVRGAVPWLAGGVAAVVFVVFGSRLVIDWQEQRTRRHEATEDHTTERHLITAQKDIALAYIAMCGDPGARQMRLGGVEGVYLPSSNELVPIDVCRAELAATQGTTLARRTTQTINVPPVQQERRFLVVGEMEQEDL